MPGATYFISDLHLSAERPEITTAFGQFLDRHRDAEALYILGDLFEFWIGDDDDSAIVHDVARLLQQFRQAGPHIYLMHGNRDFLLGERYAARLGATILPDPSVLEIDGHRLLLMHGDSLCTRDLEYQQFRTMVRSPEWQQGALSHSLEERRALAAKLRAESKHAGSRKAEDIMDVTGNEVARAMTEAQCRTLIHGHTHRPARHEIASGVRWVLGDWEQKGWYLKLEKGEINLIDFDIIQ